MNILYTCLPEIRLALRRDPDLDEYARERLFDLMLNAYRRELAKQRKVVERSGNGRPEIVITVAG